MEEDRRVWMKRYGPVIRELKWYQNMHLTAFRVRWYAFDIHHEVSVMYHGTIEQYLWHLQELSVHTLRDIWVRGDQTFVEMYKHLLSHGTLIFVAEAYLKEDGDQTVGTIFIRWRPKYHDMVLAVIKNINAIV